MKQTRFQGLTTMWYAVDKDGWGKLYTYEPQRNEEHWLSSTANEQEPNKERLILPSDAKALGRTWEDEPTKVAMAYTLTIITYENDDKENNNRDAVEGTE